VTSKEKRNYRATKKWKNFRRYLIKKNDNTCYICGIRKTGKQTRYLQIHHLDESTYGNETEKDVIPLCSADHELIEKFLRRKEFDIDLFCERLKEIYWISKNNQENPA